MSGGFGMAQMGAAFERILTIERPFQMVVIAGKNEKLRKRLAVAAKGRGDRFRVFGFVTNVQDFMEAADLVITKAGGLTVSECLAKSVPMLIFSPIPGQEERNCDYLLERGAAVKAKSIDVLDFKLKELLEDPSRLDKMRRAASKIARPDAAGEILARVLSHARPAGR
jgi:processive 1,2-diacylglycerol beta-glucosyltransferase